MDTIHSNDSPPPPSPPPPARLPSPIASLPAECLEIIFDFLQHDLSSLHKLLFVSRQFLQLTVPVLYKSPFRLAAIADSVSAGPQIDNSASGWARFLERTKHLSRLLIQNLHIPPLAPASRATKASILDDSVDLWDIEPLLSPIENPAQLKRRPSLGALSDCSVSMNVAPTGYYGPEDTSDTELPHRLDSCADLMTFDDDWSLENPGATSSSAQGDNKFGLLMDYFYFYTHQDHRSIAFVVREIYPGAGKREYDKYLAEIERAILRHNPKQIVSIHIQSPSVVIPYLQAHMEQFELLSTIRLRDPVWTGPELEMVYQFLKDHATMFPASRTLMTEDDGSRYDHRLECQHILSLRKGIHGRKAAIRHIQFATSRSYWDDARLAQQLFDPIQFMVALGPGLESIDSVHWPRTELSQLDALDVRCLRSLRIGYMTTPHVDQSFSRPEFLSRCRQLHSLDVFSSSGDMFAWAVQDWNDHRRAIIPSTLSTSNPQATTLDPQLYPWLRSLNLSGPERFKRARSIVRLQHLRVHGPTDHIVFDILRDALYSFRTTLRVLGVVSDIEYAAGGGEWLDHADELLAGQPLSETKNKKGGSGIGDHESKDKDMESSSGQGMEDKESYNLLSSIAVGSLFIRWEVPCLTDLDLTGPIASVFDVESLRYMPNLRNLTFSIITYTTTSVARNRLYRPAQTSSRGDYRTCGGGEDLTRRCDMTLLPIVTGPALRRVLIRGPWPEITDESLQTMIDTITGNVDRGLEPDNGDGGNVDEDRQWGNQLFELSVLDNPRVTVPGMVRLAQQMDQLQVMGMSLTLPAPSNNHHFHASSSSSSTYRKTGGSRYKYASEQTPPAEETDMIARKMVLKARIRLPWVDLGPEAKHLGRRIRPDGYLSRGWNM
ncbi:hypothetical protein BGX33_007632 [Mortierella sp. NVP41]|nr:hypothetical protein BGX33_007632 [Mortierella sp. NVP41]